MTNEELQAGLKAAGFYTGQVDGLVGPVTKAGCQAYRAKFGLEADIGPAMELALKAQPTSSVPAGALSLLHFIAQAESGGNYNAYYGHAKSTLPLTTYTLAQVQVFQAKLGGPSTAVGAYQFLRATLTGLAQDLGLVDTTLFSATTQDEMAFHLLTFRGWNQFVAGQITAQAFGLGISREWASMPNPSTGKSYYDGDGLNHALVGTADFLAAIERSKNQ